MAIADIAESKGKQELFARQSPQMLKALLVRKVLRDFKHQGKVIPLGRGPGAAWRKVVIPRKKGNKEGN